MYFSYEMRAISFIYMLKEPKIQMYQTGTDSGFGQSQFKNCSTLLEKSLAYFMVLKQNKPR